MTTGPSHYRTAEFLAETVEATDEDRLTTDQMLAVAQVHATLALAAAVAWTGVAHGHSPDERAGWVNALALKAAANG